MPIEFPLFGLALQAQALLCPVLVIAEDALRLAQVERHRSRLTTVAERVAFARERFAAGKG